MTRMKFAITAFTIAFWFSSSLFADDYRIISSNRAQILLADADGDITISRNIAKLWSIVLRAPDNLLPNDVAVVKALTEFNCRADKSRITAMTTYHKDYSLIKNETEINARWIPIPPDTQYSALKNFACGPQSFRKSQASLGGLPLGKIISSTYAGPWPAK